MAIRDRLLDFEQRLKRLAGEPEPTEPLEIRQAILQAIADLTQPAGRGRRILPFDRVDIDILAPTAEARRVFEAVLARDEGFAPTVRRALATAGCDGTERCRFEVRYRKRPAAGWTERQHFALRGHAEPASGLAPSASPAVPTSPVPEWPLVMLKVTKGRATKRAIEVRAERINIGRRDEVSDRERRLVRRNQVVFVEGDALSDTVSRAHAHIRCTPAGECRIRDDNSAYGTRIVRAGQMIDVLPTNTRGVRLQSGDELHIGRAVVQITIT